MNDVRLIDANRLLEVCKEAYHYEDNRGKLGYCIDAIKHAPTINAQPVKRGHWMYPKHDFFYRCSECGIELIDDHFEQIGIFKDGYMPFCPNCGADMRGDKND